MNRKSHHPFFVNFVSLASLGLVTSCSSPATTQDPPPPGADSASGSLLIENLGKSPEGWKIIESFATASPDFKRVAYTAEKIDGRGRRAIIDGVAEKEYLIVNKIKFSTGSEHYLYLGSPPGSAKTVLVVDGKARPVLPDHFSDSIQFAHGSNDVVYKVASPVPLRIGRRSAFPGYLVRNGKKGPTFDYMCNFRMSPDGESYIHGAAHRGHAVVAMNGKIVANHMLEDFPLMSDAPRFSPDSKHFCYTAVNRDGSQFAVFDGKADRRNFERVRSLVFSPDSTRTAYIGSSRGKETLVVDGKVLVTANRLSSRISFSPDSRHLACVAMDGKTRKIVIDGKPSEVIAGASTPVFGPDSKTLAYWVKRGKDDSWKLKHGEQVMEQGYPDAGYSPTFSPDGNRLAAFAVRGEERIVAVVDGKELGEFQSVSFDGFHFSPDSKHHAFWGKRDGDWYLVVDGAATKEGFKNLIEANAQVLDFDNLKDPSLHFSPDGTLRAAALRKDGSVVRIVVQPGESWETRVSEVDARADKAAKSVTSAG